MKKLAQLITENEDGEQDIVWRNDLPIALVDAITKKIQARIDSDKLPYRTIFEYAPELGKSHKVIRFKIQLDIDKRQSVHTQVWLRKFSQSPIISTRTFISHRVSDTVRGVIFNAKYYYEKLADKNNWDVT